MEEPNYDAILASKIEYYGETKAAYEFAAREYGRQCIELNKNGDIHNVTNKKYIVRLDDTTAFGCSDKFSHSKHRVFIGGLKYSEALMLKKIIENAIPNGCW